MRATQLLCKLNVIALRVMIVAQRAICAKTGHFTANNKGCINYSDFNTAAHTLSDIVRNARCSV